MYVTDVDVDTFTVIRAREGTIALVFEEDDRVFHRVTAGMLDNFMQKRSQCVFVSNANGDPNMSATRFTITPGGVTKGVSELIGPTGAGVAHAWTALDNVPEDVDWIEVSCFMKWTLDVVPAQGDITMGLPTYVDLHLSVAGASIDENDCIGSLHWQIFDGGQYDPPTGMPSGTSYVTKKIPVASGVFAAHWNGSSWLEPDYTVSIVLTLTGYGYNG
jgi:hypothetical protein